MDSHKRDSLKKKLASTESLPLVELDRFFDGNDDLSSIGCNLIEHPGLEVFRAVLLELQRRSDVQQVAVLVTEIDSDDDLWPFADTVVVVGAIDKEELEAIVEQLEPDMVDSADQEVRSAVEWEPPSEVYVIWWD